MKNSDAVEQLVPHSGTMSLLSRVTCFGEDWLEAEIDINSETLFVEPDGVPAWIGLEYMAQAIAAFSGIQEKEKGGEPKLGFLLGTRRYESNSAHFPKGEVLKVRIEREMIAENGLHIFDATLKSNHIEASARLNVFQPKNPNKYITKS